MNSTIILNSNTIYGPTIASDLGVFSGITAGAAEIPETGDDGVRLINAMDDATLNKLFSLSVDGVTDRRMLEFRAGLVRMKTPDVSYSDITEIIDNTYLLKDTKGINRVVDRISTANDPGNFKGAAFELEYAASRSVDDIIEIGRPSGIGISQPGDVDIIVNEGPCGIQAPIPQFQNSVPGM